jgi:hypothetical protein
MRWLHLASMLGATLWPTLGAMAAPGAETYSYWIEPCSEDVAARSACVAGDSELARWALDAWQQAAGPALQFVATDSRIDARIRIYWLDKRPQLYGETQVVYLNGKRSWDIDVQPDLSQFGPRIAAAGQNDRLFRDTVVYLTCLHEAGHVLSLPHTADFADIMYSFQYGGDVLEYFSRYRRTLEARSGIRAHSGISEAEQKRVARIYAGR